MTDAAGANVASGIEALIARLTKEGVDEGNAEATRIVAEAEARARATIAKAEEDAAAKVAAAKAEADRLHRGGEEALKVAMRDAVLELKESLTRGFAEEVRGAVQHMTRDDDVLRRMVIAVAGRAREEAGVDGSEDVEIVLPRSVVGLEELRRKPEELKEGSLTHFVAAAAADTLRNGVSFERSSESADGISVVLKDSGVVVDLTDKAVADVILRHLQPRFSALLEGVVS